MAVDVGSAVGYLDLDINGFLSNLKTAQSEADTATKNIATKIGKNISGVGEKLTSAGSTLTKNVTVPIAGFGAAVIKTSSDFESAMSKVSAISGATGVELDTLTAKAREMGSKTKFSASESAEAFQYMAMAGWGVEDMLNGIEGVMALAAASGEELGTVSDIVTDAMTAFGLSASGTSVVLKDGLETEVANTTRFVDALAAASNSSNTNVSMLGESFKYVAPVAGALGYSVEDVAVALGLMANQGIKSSQSGTALRTMLTNMAKPTDQMAAAMETLGVSLTDSEGNMLSLMDVMKDLRTGFGGGSIDAQEFAMSMGEIDAAFQDGQMSEEEYEAAVNDLCVAMYGAEGAQKAQLAAMLAGKTGMAGLLAIVNSTEKDFDSLTESIYNASGTSEDMAAIMQNNLSGQFTILKSMLEELALQFGEILLPIIRSFVEWLQKIVGVLQEMSPEQREQIVKWTAIAAAIGPVLLVAGKLVTGLGSLITTFGRIPGAITTVTTGFTSMVNATKRVADGFNLAKAGFTALGAQASPLGAALAGVTAPMLAIVAAVALVIAAFVSLWENNEEFRNKITAIWEQVKATFERLCSGIVDRLNQLGFDFSSIAEVLKAIWEGFCNFLAPIFEAVFQVIADTFDFIVDRILNALDFWISIFKGDWEGAWDAVKASFESVWNLIVDVFRSIGDMLLGILDTVCSWFGTMWSDTWNAIKTFFVNIWDSIVTWFQNTLNNISTFFTNIWTSVSTFFQNLWNNIVTFVTNTLDNIKSTFENIWNAVSTFLSNAWETIKNIVQVGIMFVVELITAAFELITIPFRFIWENCKETIMSIWESIKEIISNALTAIQTTITNIWNAVSEFFVSIWTSISTFVSTTWNTISSTVSDIANAIWNTITTIFNGIKDTITSIWDAIKTAISNVLNAISSFISSTWDAIKTTITNVINAIQTTISNVWNSIKTTVTNILNSVSSTISSVFNSIKSTTTSVWNSIKSAISTPFEAAKNTISSIINSIKSTISSGFNAAKSTVTSVFNSIKSAISTALNSAKSTVTSVIDSIKSKFNFSWSLPKLKLPHLSISGSFSINPPRVPRFSISWYKSAMSGGTILDSATIFGFDPKTGKFLGAGEAGSETVVGTSSLMKMIKAAVNESVGEVVQKFAAYISAISNNAFSVSDELVQNVGKLVMLGQQLVRSCEELGYVAYEGFNKPERVNERNDNNNNKANGNSGGGDTFNFYSPKPIDEIEAAKQMKKTKRDLAEGF